MQKLNGEFQHKLVKVLHSIDFVLTILEIIWIKGKALFQHYLFCLTDIYRFYFLKLHETKSVIRRRIRQTAYILVRRAPKISYRFLANLLCRFFVLLKSVFCMCLCYHWRKVCSHEVKILRKSTIWIRTFSKVK